MKGHLIIDMETRSTTELKDCGVHVYAADPATDVMCMALKMNGDAPVIWVSKPFKRLLKDDHRLPWVSDTQMLAMVEDAQEIHAHNAQFERIMWQNVMVKKYGLPPIPFDKWRCTAAKAAYYALPRSLGMVADALGLPQKKDTVGYKTMLKMCKPRDGRWNEDPADFLTLLYYCMQDVQTEYEVDKALPDIPDTELAVWRYDQEINDTGVALDLEGIQNLRVKVEKRESLYLREIQNITQGRVNSAKQVQAMVDWFKENGVILENLQKETVKTTLTGELKPHVRRMLEIRQSLAKSSVSKLDSMARWANKDGRVRGAFLYHGASTGRWAGRGIQPQNLPRESFTEEKEIEDLLGMGIYDIDAKYGCTIQAASKCIRGMIVAAPGHRLFCADFSSIEARVLAWLADEKKALHTFTTNRDPYIVAACDIYGKKYDQISKGERLLGKVCELALGYQGWLGAFDSMAQVYGVKVDVGDVTGMDQKDIDKAREEKTKNIIVKWREARPNTVAFWHGVEQAAALAVKKPGKAFWYGDHVAFAVVNNFLKCRLPSGRMLSYYNPGFKKVKTKYDVEKTVISFYGMESTTNQWMELTTYGGKLTENIVQAVARDLLVAGLLEARKAGFKTVMHVHDEIVAEVPDATPRTLDEFIGLMTKTPLWSMGCPVGASGWVGKRYRKD